MKKTWNMPQTALVWCWLS